MSVGGWDAQADSIREVGYDWKRFTEGVLGDPHRHREEGRRYRQGGTTVGEVNEPKAALPRVKRSDRKTFAE